MNADELLSQIVSRRTTRTYLRKPVSDGLLDKVLQAALSAPSAHNSQPWIFYVLRDGNAKSKLIKEMILEWERVMRLDGRPDDLISQTKAKFSARFQAAPVLVVACVNHEALYYDRYSDRHRKRLEGILGHHSLAAAIQNMLLAAHALGLGACWYSAPLFCSKRVKSALKIKGKIEPAALITIGYPASVRHKEKAVRPLGEVVVKL